ncbi:TPR-like protein [Sistotremastrum niveocremeum HHB9708]|uniref:RNA polymerase II-associated protein 3 n=1 Tax=Sistotremastrum niveocremeum HHB9708 TaxID=1314777 RepID=A0A164MQB8_9AGAM|nr:TPR-like protein [Sistotremastrum niveocremeum HHB9708]
MSTSKSAQAHKEKGNASFKAGNYAEAVGHYSAAIVADRKEPTYPLNRAAAYLKLGKNEDAERDCTTCLGLSPTNVKALFRRGQARAALGRTEDAILDFREILKLEPKNEPAKEELAKAEQKSKGKGKALSQPKPSPTVEPIVKPIRRRVPITIVEESPVPASSSPSDPPSSPIQPQAAEPSSIVETDTLRAVQTRKISTSEKPATIAPSLSPPPPKTSTGRSIGGGVFHANGSTPTLFKPPPRPSPVQNESLARPTPNDPAMSLFTFSRAMASSQKPDERWEIIKRVPPQSIPDMFGTSLEPPILHSILKTFLHVLSASKDEATSSLIREYMRALPRVARFSTVRLFFSKEEAQTISDLWEKLGQDEASRAW